jgi:hypothetical protein
LAIEEKFRFHISYGKAYMAKKKVIEMRWGTYEASYDNLPQLLNTIAMLNLGSYYDIKTYDHVSRPGKQVLQRAFLALNLWLQMATISCCHWQLLLQRERMVTVGIGFWRD